MRGEAVPTDELLEKIETIQSLLVARATGGTPSDVEYRALRDELINDGLARDKLPRFIRTCRGLAEFWGFIQPMFPTYRERRAYLWDEFRPVIEFLESATATPSDQPVSEVLSVSDSEHVQAAWHRALDRRTSDPEAAITAARSLLESTCKFILDDRNVDYDEKADLPKFYHLTASELSLAPSQHTETVFKQVLGGCQNVVQGLGTMRNRLGDSHGKGKSGPRPESRHAELAVNLAGTMATFLFRTWEERHK